MTSGSSSSNGFGSFPLIFSSSSSSSTIPNLNLQRIFQIWKVKNFSKNLCNLKKYIQKAKVTEVLLLCACWWRGIPNREFEFTYLPIRRLCNHQRMPLVKRLSFVLVYPRCILMSLYLSSQDDTWICCCVASINWMRWRLFGYHCVYCILWCQITSLSLSRMVGPFVSNGYNWDENFKVQFLVEK